MNISALTAGFNQSRETLGKVDLDNAYLSFQLDEQNPAVFSMDQVKEVIVIPAREITPMPNVPECVLGLLARRSRVMWVVDLAQMLTSKSLTSNIRQYKVIIIQVNQTLGPSNLLLTPSQSQALLGLIVLEVKGGVRFPVDLIKSPPENLSLSLTPCLKGCVRQPDSILLVLDAEAIAHSLRLQSN
ncbi:chemotaxis protein CheW [Lyngbya aestuarii]|uniref:chemotaxis protein CheW n=1 Tax=Lyngbya aestuarii TaxID=118322 RepID=UPI00403E244F